MNAGQVNIRHQIRATRRGRRQNGWGPSIATAMVTFFFCLGVWNTVVYFAGLLQGR